MIPLADVFQAERIILANDSSRVLAYCSVKVAGHFVLSDLRLIEDNGKRFVSFPGHSARVTCLQCESRVYHTAKFCPMCGHPLRHRGLPLHANGDAIRYYDTFYPIDLAGREFIERIAWDAYDAALAAALQPVLIPEIAS